MCGAYRRRLQAGHAVDGAGSCPCRLLTFGIRRGERRHRRARAAGGRGTLRDALAQLPQFEGLIRGFPTT